MVWQKSLIALSAICVLFAGAGGIAAEGQADAAPDMALLEFLGSMEEEADEWEAFIDIAAEDAPPMVAEMANDH